MYEQSIFDNEILYGLKNGLMMNIMIIRNFIFVKLCINKVKF
jgi:hypothetical protein